jgi:dynein heavy chain
MILRTLRNDKMIPAINNFVVEVMGQKFVDPPPFDLEKIYSDSSPTTPLIFILSPGSDPFASLNSFA